jgi:cell division septal protein FtsQ
MVIIIALVGLSWILLFSSWVRITIVSITGLQRVDRAVIQTLADVELNHNLLWVVPKRTWTLAPIAVIKDRISELPAIARVEVKKRFPNSVIITIEERLASVTWQTSAQRFEVDNTSLAIRELPTTTESLLPLVTDDTNSPLSLGSSAAPAELIQLVLDINQLLAGRGVTNYSVEEVRDHIQVHLGTWRIYLGNQASVSDQLLALDALLGSLTAEQIKKLDYIDVRVPDLPTYKFN